MLPSRGLSNCIIFFLGLLLHLSGCFRVYPSICRSGCDLREIFFSHPSRCSEMRILRDALMCASFEMLWCVHPSRCFVLILRGVLICASFEVLCYTSLVVLRFLYSSASLVVLGPEELSARGIFKKNVSPFLALGSLVSLFRRLGVVAFLLVLVAIRGNARKFCFFFKKRLPLTCALLSHGIVEWWMPRVRKEKTSPPFWHPSFDSLELLFCCRFFCSDHL